MKYNITGYHLEHKSFEADELKVKRHGEALFFKNGELILVLGGGSWDAIQVVED